MDKEKVITLVQKAQQGDGEALNALFTEHYENLYYFALKYVRNQDLAYDITQESFEIIYKTIGSLKEPAAFNVWTRQIVYRQCLHHFNKKTDVLVEENEDGSTIFDIVEDETTEFVPGEEMEKTEFKETIMGMIDTLPEEQRTALLMLYYEELSVKQIAEIQGVSEGTVKSRLNYGRKAVKVAVEEYERKHNIKLHSFGFAPFLYWLFAQEKNATVMPKMMVQKMAQALAGKTVVSTATSTATKVGIGAKIAAIPMAGKIAACVVAVAIVAGAGIAMIPPTEESVDFEEIVNHDENTMEDLQDEDSEAKLEEGQNADDEMVEEDMQGLDKSIAESYFQFVISLGSAKKMIAGLEDSITTFQSTDELTTEDFLWEVYRGTTVGNVELKMEEQYLGQNEWEMDLYIYTVKVSDLNAFTEAIFGRTFDYTNASGEHPFFGKYYYDATIDSIVYDNSEGGEGGGEMLVEYVFDTIEFVEGNDEYTLRYYEVALDSGTVGQEWQLLLKENDGKLIIISNTAS